MSTAWGWVSFRYLGVVGLNNAGTMGVRLFKTMVNVASPAEDATLTESSWPGYHGLNLPAWVEQSAPSTPLWTASWPAVSWTAGTIVTPESIVGWGLYTGVGPLYVEELASPILVNTTGQVVSLQVDLSLEGL
jgi:hypothetical protein